MAGSYKISDLLEKMTNSDKDFRFMATNDLINELEKDSIKLDDESERKVVKALLKLLDDKNGEVQNLVVRCLAVLINKIKESQVDLIVNALCCNMISSEKEQLRDISSVGLKAIIGELPQIRENISKDITVCLTATIAKGDRDTSVQLEVLDITCDLLTRFGTSLSSANHEGILNALTSQLESPRQAVRKRTISALGCLVQTCNSAIYDKLVEFIYDKLINKQKNDDNNKCTYIQCVSAICKNSRLQFGPLLPKFFDAIFDFDPSNINHEINEELTEACLQTFECFITCCPKEVTCYLPKIMLMSTHFIGYDPNYAYDDDDSNEDSNVNVNINITLTQDVNMDMDDEEEDDEDEDDQDDEEEEEEEEYSDNDDVTWKLRRASAKCLEAVILTRHESLKDFYENIAPLLISRFKEREENVKSDIIQTYIVLLKQTKNVVNNSKSLTINDLNQDHDVDMIDVNNQDEDDKTRTRVQEDVLIIKLLLKQINDLVKAINKMLVKEKSVKTKLNCLKLIRELTGVINDCFSSQKDVQKIVLAILTCFNESKKRDSNNTSSSSSLKIEALLTLNSVLTTHSFEDKLEKVLPLCVPLIVKCVNDPFYKISSEALSVLKELIAAQKINESRIQNVNELFKAVFVKLKINDQDQEVKDKAITTMGVLISKMGHLLTEKQLEEVWEILLIRLKNEITRLTTVKALITILSSTTSSSSASKMNFKEALPVLASFLRKNHRGLKQSSLILINTILEKNVYVNVNSGDQLKEILFQLPPLLKNPSDLYTTQFVLNILINIVVKYPNMLNKDLHKDLHLLVIEELLYSPLLQGDCLKAVIEYLQLTHLTEFDALINKLYVNNIVNSVKPNKKHHKQVYSNIAKCLSVLILAKASEEGSLNQSPTCNKCLDLMLINALTCNNDKDKEDNINSERQMFSLLIIGELGKKCDLKKRDLAQGILNILLNLTAVNEDVKFAASYALGGIAIGNVNTHLPFILRQINTSSNSVKYLLMLSLKDVIDSLLVVLNRDDNLKIMLLKIWEELFKHCENEEEGIRNVVAECLGKLTVVNPGELLKCLTTHVKDSASSLIRATMVTAFKHVLLTDVDAILLKSVVNDFVLTTLKDPNMNVRHVALKALNSAAHNRAFLIRDLLENEILPLLYEETKIKKELIREVEMGPFKHIVDDGLDMRKAAFECMYTIIDSSFDKINVFDYLIHVEDGLKDHYDIKILTYLIVCKLVRKHPICVLTRMDKLVEALKDTCCVKLKVNAVKQEHEKQEELKRAALRTFLVLCEIPDAEKNTSVTSFLHFIKHNFELQALLEQVKELKN